MLDELETEIVLTNPGDGSQIKFKYSRTNGGAVITRSINVGGGFSTPTPITIEEINLRAADLLRVAKHFEELDRLPVS